MRNRSLLLKTICVVIAAFCIALPSFGQSGIKVLAFPMEPFSIDEKGQATGYAVDLMAKLIGASGLNLPKTEMLPLTRFTATMDEGNAIGIAVGRTPERDPKYQWLAEFYTESFSFATRTGAPVINTFEEAKAAGTILAIKTGAPDTVLRASGVTNIDNSANFNAQQLQMLLAGRGVAWFSGTAALKHIIATNNAGDKVVLGKPLRPVGVWIAASKNVPPDVIQKLQAAYKTIKASGEYEKIFAPLK